MSPKTWFVISIFLIVNLSACKKTPYFRGEITVFDDFDKKIQLKGEKIELEGIYTGSMSVYDTLALFISYQFPDQNFLHVFGLHSGKELGSFCTQGRGPGEYLDLSCFDQFQKENGDIKLWIGSTLKEQIQLLNLSESLKKQKMQVDQSFFLDWRKKWKDPIASFFMLDSNLCLYHNLNEYLYKDKRGYTLGLFHLCKDSIENELKEYPLFNRPLLNPHPQIENRYLLSSDHRIKPDGSKIAMTMDRLMQINILDIRTGKLKGFRLKDSPDFEDLKRPLEDLKYFYINLCVDANYIYALCLNCAAKDFPVESDLIHVFDWNGNPVCQITTDQKFFSIAFDPVHGLIYGKNFMEEIYCYDIYALLKP